MDEDSLEGQGQPKEEFPTIVAERGRGIMSLGGLLRDLRISRGMEQRDLEAAVQSAGVSQAVLSRFERGADRPRKDQIDSLLLILHPDSKVRNDILLAGGYLPSKDELERYKGTFDAILQDWSKRGLPCVIMEGMGWRYVAWNNEANELFGLDQAREIKGGETKTAKEERVLAPEERFLRAISGEEEKQTKGKAARVVKDDELTGYPQLVEMILNPEYKLHQLVFSAPPALAEEFAAQQLNNFQRQTEAWNKLPWHKAIMNDIYRSPHFAIVRRRSESHSDTPSWLSYGHTEFPVNVDGKRLQLMEFASELNTDRRFEVLRYVPLPQSKP